MLAHLPVDEWKEPLFKSLVGDCDGLSEIRFKADKVQQRPLCFRSGEREHTIVFWATEKGDKWVPRSACATAKQRKAEVLNNRSLTNALWLALE
jgi:hypothetical protein